jgi:PhnB protein
MQTQGVVPMLSYENGVAALEWLANVFGFQEKSRMLDEKNKRLAHGEMETGNGIIMLATPTPYYESPVKHRQHCEQARKWHEVPWVIDGVLVYVDNIDAHYHRAKNAGATILSQIEEGFPARRYRAEDLEEHRWMFMQKEK